MIQRIQTLWLFLIVVCTVTSLLTPVGLFHQDGIPVADFYNLCLIRADGTRSYAPWALFLLLALTSIASATAIFLYKHRMLQVRLCVFGGILMIGYYAVWGVFVKVLSNQYNADYSLHWSVALPAVALILFWLAFRGIMKDELLIRSINRLR